VLPSAARRLFLTGGGGAPADFYRRRRSAASRSKQYTLLKNCREIKQTRLAKQLLCNVAL